MPKSQQEIVDDIKSHIQERGGDHCDWYVGISKDAKDKLFNGHRVKEKRDVWIYRKSNSPHIAREVEGYFVNTLNTDGNTGGGDDVSDMVYAYKKAKHTNP